MLLGSVWKDGSLYAVSTQIHRNGVIVGDSYECPRTCLVTLVPSSELNIFGSLYSHVDYSCAAVVGTISPNMDLYSPPHDSSPVVVILQL